MPLPEIRQKLCSFADEQAAASAQRFFKTGTGALGGAFEIIGVRAPQLRQLVREYPQITFAEARTLLRSKIHEERALALLILVHMFSKADEKMRKKIFDFYVKNRKYYSSWALVDASARDIAGKYLEDKNRQPLFDLAKSASLWDRRIAIVATQHFIKQNDFADTLKIAELLLEDEEDLIHKAVGWMLREVGERDLPSEEKFLRRHYNKMPRTMLRYAIEKFPEENRQRYLKGLI